MTNLDHWDAGTDIMTLMTLHMAKGLEFPIVYIVGLEEGIFPNANAYGDDEEDLEEERRLCYVGITRAKEVLYLTYARERLLYGSSQYNLPSRFLNEIPNELCGVEGGSDPVSPGPARHDDEIVVEDIDIDIDPDKLEKDINIE